MPVWGWILVGLGVAVFGALVVWEMLSLRRSRQLQRRFGPEYDRAVDASGSRREAESELAARAERRDRLEIKPLSREERQRYAEEWQLIQAQFVDDPAGAVTRGDGLIQTVLAARGYPVEDFDQRAADISVDHPDVVEHYRDGHRLYERTAAGRGSTEDLRQAMRHYRTLLETLLEAPDAGGAGPEENTLTAGRDSEPQRGGEERLQRI